jgi:hypothetical protein
MDGLDLPQTRAELLAFEIALAARDASGLDVELANLIADEFVEFGASGRSWTATTIRAALATPAQVRPTIEDFEIDILGDGVVLATYRISAPVPAHRSSIWIRRDGAWQIRFHQGTRS